MDVLCVKVRQLSCGALVALMHGQVDVYGVCTWPSGGHGFRVSAS
jgi:hypothetical protein